ncbi:MAG TPA: hypothetical protein VGV92_09600 [Gammaproteobacteria bacterium]|nr:hypothetical protein [Gammaproteobacteria bacterium]
MKELLMYGPFMLQYGPTIFGLISSLFWLLAAFVKIPNSKNAEIEHHMRQLRKQSLFIAIASFFAATMILLQTFCHITGY